MFRKLQWQLTGIFTLILAVILVTTNVMVYLLLERSNQQRLTEDIEAVLAAVEDTSWMTQEDLNSDNNLEPMKEEAVDKNLKQSGDEEEDSETETDESNEALEKVDVEEMDASDGNIHLDSSDELDSSDDLTEIEDGKSTEDDKDLESAEEIEKAEEIEEAEEIKESDKADEADDLYDDVIEVGGLGASEEAGESHTASEEEHEEYEMFAADGISKMDIVIPYSVAGYPYYSIRDLEGNLVTSNAMDAVLAEKLSSYEAELVNQLDPVMIDLTQEGQGYYLMVKDSVTIDGVVYGEVFVAQNITLAFETLHLLKRVMFFVTLLEIFLAFGLAYILAGRFIKPVKNAYKMKEQFIGDASHELRTPISVLMLSLDYLKSDKETMTPEQRETIEDMTEETGKMKALVERLLLFARHDSDRLVMDSESLDFVELIEDEIRRRKTMIESKELEVQVDLPPSMVLHGDVQLLKMVIGTLIDNAVKYNWQGGSIQVDGQIQHVRKKDVHIIQISNTGYAPAKDEIAKVFERFYRGDQSRSKKNEGYGLGLSLAKDIIEEHGGMIYAEGEKDQYFSVTFKL